STQITALVGWHGINPAAMLMEALKHHAEKLGVPLQCYLSMPTVAWFNSSDSALSAICLGGLAASLLVLAGVLTVPALVACFVLYLSIVHVGQEFMSFQWDWLLLETGFLALIFAPWQLLEAPWPRAKQPEPPSRIAIWLLRLLLFKLMFMSGLCKLQSDDPTWRDLTALNYHYWTQPLPTPLGWLAAQMPEWFEKLSVVIMFVIELGAPFLIFAGRKMRMIAASLICMLQFLILLTGNYTFFNWLTISLCILLLDDAIVAVCLPKRIFESLKQQGTHGISFLHKFSNAVMEAIVIIMALIHVSGAASLVYPLYSTLAPFGLYNSYGLFAVMTTERNEIVIEGSNDKVVWLEYQFPFKPGDVKRAPPIVAPFQPRLDWQLWFAALGTASDNRWFGNFVLRLLQGSPDVLHLLCANPFPDKPPRYIRASLYRYRFTDIPTLIKTGQWWNRTFSGEYFPPSSLDDLIL
ncbi:MAG: lipase maturation factor family protein, partial [Terriglobales bacterium]